MNSNKSFDFVEYIRSKMAFTKKVVDPNAQKEKDKLEFSRLVTEILYGESDPQKLVKTDECKGFL